MTETFQDGFVRFDEVKKLTGLSRTTTWRMERAGDFPQRRQLSANTTGWLKSEILTWCANRPRIARRKGDRNV